MSYATLKAVSNRAKIDIRLPNPFKSNTLFSYLGVTLNYMSRHLEGKIQRIFFLSKGCQSACIPRLNELLNIHLGDRYYDAAEILCIIRNSQENYTISLMYVN